MLLVLRVNRRRWVVKVGPFLSFVQQFPISQLPPPLHAPSSPTAPISALSFIHPSHQPAQMGGIPSVRALPDALNSSDVRKLCGALYDEEWFERNQDAEKMVSKRALVEEAASRSIDETSHVLLANLQQFVEVKARLNSTWDEVKGSEIVHDPKYKSFDKTRDGMKQGQCDHKWRQQCLRKVSFEQSQRKPCSPELETDLVVYAHFCRQGFMCAILTICTSQPKPRFQSSRRCW